MTLAEVCEPLFQYVCRINRSARKGVHPDMAQVRSEVKGVLAECRTRAGQNQQLEAWQKIEIILVYFVDYMIRSSTLSFAKQWQDMAAERGQMAGDEDFFDQLDGALKDPSDAATERLAVFYTCLGLGFTGWYAGQPDVLRKKMLEISARVRSQMDADENSKITPEAYEKVNTEILQQPVAGGVMTWVIVLVGMTLALVASSWFGYKSAIQKLGETLTTIIGGQSAQSGDK